MKLIVALITLSMLAACATARSTAVAFKDPSAPIKPYRRILIELPHPHLETQVYVEKLARERLSKLSSTEFLLAHELLPPTRKYTNKEISDILKKDHIEAILWHQSSNVSTNTTYATVPTFNTASGYVGGKYVNLMASGNTTIPVTTASWTSEIYLSDIAQKKIVWRASSSTAGDNYNAMLRTVVKRVSTELCQSGLIAVADPGKCWPRKQ